MEEGIGLGKRLVQQILVIGLLIDVSLANNIGWKVRQMVKYHTNKLFLSPVVRDVHESSLGNHGIQQSNFCTRPKSKFLNTFNHFNILLGM